MPESPLELKFDPHTINHLGLRMYSSLPPALAEIISNSYDADAEKVIITLSEENGTPNEITIEDDGIGLSYDEIQNKFLIIGRNRRIDGDLPSAKFKRLPTGKKGLGKLALFGLAKTITISTIQNNKLNEFVMDWDDLMKADNVYRPTATKINEDTIKNNGTKITLTGLKRKTSFDISGLADSLSRIFLFDENFNLVIISPKGEKVSIDNIRKYSTLQIEFSWSLDSPLLVPETSDYYQKITGELITSEKPIPPSSGLRGITLFSRGKLVNAPEFFSISASSHFYQYLTGWIRADFIDLVADDVISTNRQSLNWEQPDMAKFRNFLSGIVSQVNADWRRKRKEKKDKDLKEKTGIDTASWTATMPDEVKEKALIILGLLGGEDALEKYTPVIKALHAIIPEYPLLHWRHLHPTVQDASIKYYIDKNYYTAFLEATKKYVNATMQKSGKYELAERDLMGNVFSGGINAILNVVNKYKQSDGNDFSNKTQQNIQDGQQYLSQGLIVGGRHPLSHEEIKELRISDLFSEKDCLDLLSLLSHLFKRLDNSIKKAP